MFSNFFLRWPRLRISSVSYLRLILIPFPSHLYFSSTDKTSLWQEAQYVAIHYCHSHYLHWWVSCDPAVQTLSTLHHYFFIFIFSLKVIWLLTPTTDCHFFSERLNKSNDCQHNVDRRLELTSSSVESAAKAPLFFFTLDLTQRNVLQTAGATQ